MEILEFLKSNSEVAVVLKLVVATLCGSLIGWERFVKGHTAGIKTFALVSLGSAVATALNVYLAMLPGLNADVSRIPAGVVSGIGFLGAGTILITGKKQIKGLTTAASLWVTACMGMAIGAGYIIVGITCFVLVLIANVVLMNVSNIVEEYSKYLSIYIEVNKGSVTKLNKFLAEEELAVSSMTKSKEKTLQNSDVALLIDIECNKGRAHRDIIKRLQELDYVNYVEEV